MVLLTPWHCRGANQYEAGTSVIASLGSCCHPILIIAMQYIDYHALHICVGKM